MMAKEAVLMEKIKCYETISVGSYRYNAQKKYQT